MEALRGRGSARVMGDGRVEEWGRLPVEIPCKQVRAEGAFLAPGEDGEVGAGRGGCSWEQPEHSCLLPAPLPFRAPPACSGWEGGWARLGCTPGPPEERAWQGPAQPARWDPGPTASLCGSASPGRPSSQERGQPGHKDQARAPVQE